MDKTMKAGSVVTRILAAMVVILGLSVVGMAPANAGPQHHGSDPAATGCNKNASLIATRGVETEFGQVVATVQVYYSHSCQTNWIRVTGNPGGGAAIKSIGTNGSWLPNEIDYGTGSSYSMQVYAPGSTCVNFQVELRNANGTHLAETYDPGANHQTVC